MLVKTDGIVIKDSFYSEKDKILTILTSEMGVIRAFAKGCRSSKSKNFSSAQFLHYSDFVFFNKKDTYVLNESYLKRSFLGLRNDLESLIIAQYICEVIIYLVKENIETSDILRLVLNSIYALTNKKFNKKIIKSVFELRLLSVLGYQPNFSECKFCKSSNLMLPYFFSPDSSLICEKCIKNINFVNRKNYIKLNLSLLKALKYSIFSYPKSMFSFSLNEENLKTFSFIAQKCITEHIKKPLNTLKMYENYLK